VKIRVIREILLLKNPDICSSCLPHRRKTAWHFLLNTMFMSKKIAIIGGGNLGAAIAEGLIQSEFSRPVELSITRRNLSPLSRFAEQGSMVHSDNKKAVKTAEIIILAVKPYNFADIIDEIKTTLDPKKHVVVSVITGVWIEQIQKAIGKPVPVIRAMPNTAIAIQQSMTCLAHADASTSQINYIRQLFDQLGKTVMIDEKLMDAATILGACGTAYAMRYIRANIQGGIEIGFDAATATLIAAQTVKGAAQLLLEKGSHPEQEIDKVTTPKGCTIAGLNEMEHQGFSSSLIRGVVASYKKIAKDLS
jgi:pyrroline-5-carboxylate reductase